MRVQSCVGLLKPLFLLPRQFHTFAPFIKFKEMKWEIDTGTKCVGTEQDMIMERDEITRLEIFECEDF